ncbi:hypothetical protein [Homoserinimonas sp. A520]
MKSSQSDRIALWLVLLAALAYSVATLIFGMAHGAQVAFAPGETPVGLLASAPVPTDLDGEATIVSGSFTDASLTVSGLSTFARVMLSIGVAVGLVASLAVSLAIAYFCWSLLRARPFRRSLTVAAIIAGTALSVGGLLGQAAIGFGTMQAALDVDPAGAVFEAGFWFDPAPLLGGFAILALGIAFQLGERLQRDTEGLV